jgi:hypothetical protein
MTARQSDGNKAARPTFTAVPGIARLIVTPTSEPDQAGPTQTPTASPSPTPTLTGTPTPTPAPTPYAEAKAWPIKGWRGPGRSFDYLGQALKRTKFVVLARTTDDAWLRICCIANQAAWVPADLVAVQGGLESVPALTPVPTPSPSLTPTSGPTSTPSPTPLPPFDIARGPEFPWQVDTGLLTIRIKVYEGPSDNERPLGGYELKVLRNGSDVSLPDRSRDAVAGFDSTGPNAGNYLYNLKFEFPNAGQADWTIYLARVDGSRVSPVTLFTTAGNSSRNLVVFIGYRLVR